MPPIPLELLPHLTRLGIAHPESSPWKHLDDWRLHYIRAHYFCPCGQRPAGQQRAELTFTCLRGRRVFIGQCKWCQTVYWRDAVSDD